MGNYNLLSGGNQGLSTKQLPLFNPEDEVSCYLDCEDERGYFSILTQQSDGSKRQESFPLEHMPIVLDMLNPNRDSWISQASFFPTQSACRQSSKRRFVLYGHRLLSA